MKSNSEVTSTSVSYWGVSTVANTTTTVVFYTTYQYCEYHAK